MHHHHRGECRLEGRPGFPYGLALMRAVHGGIEERIDMCSRGEVRSGIYSAFAYSVNDGDRTAATFTSIGSLTPL